jgi:DNA-binding response OmpR family regulator
VRPTILVVEDDIPLRQLYRTALTGAGYNVREVGDGFTALQAFETYRPHLVVLNLMLPQVNGHIVREEMLAHSHLRHIPVVVVTGAASDGPELYQLEAECILKKPIAPDALVDAVRKCLRSSAP